VAATFVGAIAGWGLTSIDPTEAYPLDASFSIPNAVLAGVVMAQWLVLRWWFSVSAWWVLASVLGLILFGLLSIWTINVIVIVVVGVGLGLWQRQRVEQIVSHLAHRQRGGWALLWVVVSAVGFATQVIVQLGLGIVIFWLFFSNESHLILGMIIGIVSALFTSLLFGIVTGTALIWLLRRPPPEENSPSQDSQIMPQ